MPIGFPLDLESILKPRRTPAHAAFSRATLTRGTCCGEQYQKNAFESSHSRRGGMRHRIPRIRIAGHDVERACQRLRFFESPARWCLQHAERVRTCKARCWSAASRGRADGNDQTSAPCIAALRDAAHGVCRTDVARAASTAYLIWSFMRTANDLRFCTRSAAPAARVDMLLVVCCRRLRRRAIVLHPAPPPPSSSFGRHAMPTTSAAR